MPTSQSDRVDTMLRELHEAENALRHAAANGPEPDADLHSELASKIREQIGAVPHGDLKSLALRLIVHGVNRAKWNRCTACAKPDYLGEASRDR